MLKLSRKFLAGAAITCVALAASAASAANQQIVQAGQGRPFYLEGKQWSEIFDTQNFEIVDGRRVYLSTSGLATWVTPVNVLEDNKTLYATWTGWKTESGATLRTRICSFYSYGLLHYCSSFSSPSGTGTLVGNVNVTVPAGGTAYAQTEMNNVGSGDKVVLETIRFYQN